MKLFRMIAGVALGAALLLPDRTFSQQETPDLAALTRAYLDERDDAKAGDLLGKLLDTQSDIGALQKILAEGSAHTAPGEILRFTDDTVKHSDGVERLLSYRTPKTYDPAQKHPLILFLHGGVGTPATDVGKQVLRQLDFDCNDNNWFLACPSENEAPWYSPEGAMVIRECIEHMKERFNIDENKIFVTGFSDGGTGSWYLAQHMPDVFAGVIPCAGHPGLVDTLMPANYIINLTNTRLYTVTGGADSLYPPQQLDPYLKSVQTLIPDMKWTVYPEKDHDFTMITEEKEKLIEWMRETARNPLPSVIDWQCCDKTPRDAFWLRVDKLGDVGNNHAFEELKLKTTRPVMGINIDQQFTGPGVKITTVQDGSAAQEAGLETGDVITAFNGKEISGLPALGVELQAITEPGEIAVTITRGEESLDKTIALTPGRIFKTPAGTARARLEAKGNAIDVKCSHVAEFTLLLNPQQFDLTQPLTVTVNGKKAFEGTVTPDTKVLLGEARRRLDRSMLFTAQVTVQVPN